MDETSQRERLTQERFVCVSIPNVEWSVEFEDYIKETTQMLCEKVYEFESQSEDTSDELQVPAFRYSVIRKAGCMSFIYCNHPAVCNLWKGLNYDGESLIEYTPNPDYNGTIYTEKLVKKVIHHKIDDLDSISGNFSWADIVETDEGFFTTEEVETVETIIDPEELSKSRIATHKPIVELPQFTFLSQSGEIKNYTPCVEPLYRNLNFHIEYFSNSVPGDSSTFYCSKFPEEVPPAVIYDNVLRVFNNGKHNISLLVSRGRKNCQLFVHYDGSEEWYCLFVAEIIKYTKIMYKGREYLLRFDPSPIGIYKNVKAKYDTMLRGSSDKSSKNNQRSQEIHKQLVRQFYQIKSQR